MKTIHLAIQPPVVVIVAAAVLVTSAGAIAASRTQGNLAVSIEQQAQVLVKGPLVVNFSQDVATGLQPAIEPALAGEWRFRRSPLGVTGVVFTPSERFEAGRSYNLSFTRLRRSITGLRLADIQHTFTVQTPPEVKTFYPQNKSQGVAAKPQLIVAFNQANQGIRELTAKLEPEVPLKLVSNDDRTFVWEPVTALQQGANYTFVLEDGRMPMDKKRLVTTEFRTVTPPGIVSARTGGYFSPGQSVEIVFDQPMELETVAFRFDTSGKGGWANDRTYRYTPTGLKPGTQYGYVVKAGLTSKAGGILEADRTFQFTTTGAVTASLSPGGTVGLNSPIRVSFDQAVDHASAESRFSIAPAVPGKFSWSGNTMTYTPSGMAYQTTYSFSVAAGVAPVWGLPSTRAMTGSYTTEHPVIKLAVPNYKQPYGRSCEITSLRMLLAFRGIYTSELDILARIGYSPRERDTATNSWENPNQMFVGFIDAFTWNRGYGVHAGPVAAAGQSYGRSTTAHFGVSASFMASHIHAGRPVAFWGHISPSKADAWNTPSGVVQTTTSMHARVAYGVAGRADAPIGFYIHDPWTGTSYYWTTAQVMTNMNVVPGVSNQAVVVY